jgi:hypothetical protein
LAPLLTFSRKAARNEDHSVRIATALPMWPIPKIQ